MIHFTIFAFLILFLPHTIQGGNLTSIYILIIIFRVRMKRYIYSVNFFSSVITQYWNFENVRKMNLCIFYYKNDHVEISVCFVLDNDVRILWDFLFFSSNIIFFTSSVHIFIFLVMNQFEERKKKKFVLIMINL